MILIFRISFCRWRRWGSFYFSARLYNERAGDVQIPINSVSHRGHSRALLNATAESNQHVCKKYHLVNMKAFLKVGHFLD